MADKSDILTELRESIKSINENINTQPGSVVSDIVLNPLVNAIFKQRSRTQITSIFQSLDLILALLSDQALLDQAAEDIGIDPADLSEQLSFIIESEASNWGITRRDKTRASEIVTFHRFYDVGDTTVVSIPTGTTIARTDNVEYRTTSPATLTDASPFSSALNANFVDVPMEAVELGTSPNAIENSIIIIVSGVTDPDTSVINLDAIDNGLDIETDAELVEVIRTKLTGNNLGVEDGYISLIRNNFNLVDELLLVGPGDPEMERSQFGGEIDIYIKGSLPTQVTQSVISTFGIDEYQLDNVPVNENLSMTVPTFVQDTDFQLLKDTGTRADSSAAQDKIDWSLSAVPLPNFDVTYTYNKLIQDIQTFLDDPINKIVTSDVLVREAIEITANITLKITLFSGFNFQSTSDLVQIAVGEFILALGMNESLFRADIIEIAQGIDGVENTTDVLINGLDDDLESSRKSFITPGTVIITQA